MKLQRRHLLTSQRVGEGGDAGHLGLLVQAFGAVVWFSWGCRYRFRHIAHRYVHAKRCPVQNLYRMHLSVPTEHVIGRPLSANGCRGPT